MKKMKDEMKRIRDEEKENRLLKRGTKPREGTTGKCSLKVVTVHIF